jgi:hypothetical protein
LNAKGTKQNILAPDVDYPEDAYDDACEQEYFDDQTFITTDTSILNHQPGGDIAAISINEGAYRQMRATSLGSTPICIVLISATISQKFFSSAHDKQYQESLIELDYHADTSCVGANCQNIACIDRVCSVTPYHP